MTLLCILLLLNTKYSLPKKMAPQNTQNRTIFSLPKTTCPGITHAVNINTAVSTESTYCPPPSSISLLLSWSEILGCKVGPHFVANAYECIQDQNTRRARESKIYDIDFGVSTTRFARPAFLRPLISNSSRVRRKGLETRLSVIYKRVSIK